QLPESAERQIGQDPQAIEDPPPVHLLDWQQGSLASAQRGARGRLRQAAEDGIAKDLTRLDRARDDMDVLGQRFGKRLMLQAILVSHASTVEADRWMEVLAPAELQQLDELLFRQAPRAQRDHT